jgi:ribonuclease Z
MMFMMIKTVILGTAGSAPTRERRMPSMVVIYEGDILMFDCGEGTQFRMLDLGLNPVKIKAIFLSHTHGDHTIGIAGLVRTMALNSRTEPLLIFVPKGYEKVVQNLIVFDKAIISYPIIIKGIQTGKVFSTKNYEISAFKLTHTIPTYGYVFKEKDRLRFKEEIAHKLGLRDEMFSQIKQKGYLTIDKRKIMLSQVTTKQEGKKIVYATDTRPSITTIAAAKGADLLVHEASYKSSEIEIAKRRKHASSGEVAALAKKAHVKRLVLTHISARHKTDTELLNDAKRIFKDTVVAKDGYTLVI